MTQIGLYETLKLLERLGYPCVEIKPLLQTFFPEPEEPLQPPPPIPEPKEKVYKTLAEAKKAAKKGEETVRDANLGGYINVPG